MHAVAANVSGQIASVVAGGVVLQYFANMLIGGIEHECRMIQNLEAAAGMLFQGMVGIFVVLGIIALLVLLMGKTGGKKKG